MKQWWAARVMTGQEYQIKKTVRASIKDCDIYIPRRLVTDMVRGKIEQKTENILPGYVLLGTEQELTVGNLDGFIKILGTISEEEMDSLKLQEYNEAEDSGFETNSKIIINDGPFIGCKGTITSKEDDMLSVRIMFQGIEVNADIQSKNLNTI